jgi:hypothetical protein
LDQRLLFSALTVEFLVLLWPWFLLDSGIVVVFLAEISVLLAAASLGMSVVGVWRTGAMRLRASQLLVVFSLIAVPGSWISMGYFIGAGRWAAMDCNYLEQWKCNIVQAAGYANLYLIPALLVPIILLVFGLGSLVSLDRLSQH